MELHLRRREAEEEQGFGVAAMRCSHWRLVSIHHLRWENEARVFQRLNVRAKPGQVSQGWRAGEASPRCSPRGWSDGIYDDPGGTEPMAPPKSSIG